jgi:hypothetical protein
MAAQNEEKSSAAGSADQRTKDWRLGGHRHRGTCKHHVSEVMESTDVAMAAFMAQTVRSLPVYKCVRAWLRDLLSVQVPCGARSSPPSTTSKDNLPDTLRVEHAGYMQTRHAVRVRAADGKYLYAFAGAQRLSRRTINCMQPCWPYLGSSSTVLPTERPAPLTPAKHLLHCRHDLTRCCACRTHEAGEHRD